MLGQLPVIFNRVPCPWATIGCHNITPTGQRNLAGLNEIIYRFMGVHEAIWIGDRYNVPVYIFK